MKQSGVVVGRSENNSIWEQIKKSHQNLADGLFTKISKEPKRLPNDYVRTRYYIHGHLSPPPKAINTP